MKKLFLLLILLPALAWAGDFGSSIEGKNANVTFVHTSAIDSAHVIFAYPDTSNWYDSVFTYPVLWGSSKIMNGAGLDLDSIGVHIVKIRYYSGGAVAGHTAGIWLHEGDSLYNALADANKDNFKADVTNLDVAVSSRYANTDSLGNALHTLLTNLDASISSRFANTDSLGNALHTLLTNLDVVLSTRYANNDSLGNALHTLLTNLDAAVSGIDDNPWNNALTDTASGMGDWFADYFNAVFGPNTDDIPGDLWGADTGGLALTKFGGAILDYDNYKGSGTGATAQEVWEYSGGRSVDGGAIGECTTTVNLTTNNDKTGYSLTTQDWSTHSAADVWGVGTRALTDKSGFSLASPQTFDNTGTWTGNLSGSVGSVTSDVGITQAGADKAWGTAVRSLTDKAGFGLASAEYTNIWNKDISAYAGAGYAGTYLKNLWDKKPAGNFLSDDVWTDAKAGYLDVAIGSRSSHGAGDVWNVDTSGVWNDDLSKFGEWNAQAQVGGGAGSSPWTAAGVGSVYVFMDSSLAWSGNMALYWGAKADGYYQVLYPSDGSANKDSVRIFDDAGVCRGTVYFHHSNVETVVDSVTYRKW